MAAGRPYFGSQIGGVQSNPRRYGHMAELVRFLCSSDRAPDHPVKILEIGSWIGASAITWALAIAEFNDGVGQVICVDPWQDLRTCRTTGRPYDDMMNFVHKNGIAWELFHHNVNVCGVGKLVHAVRGTSE